MTSGFGAKEIKDAQNLLALFESLRTPTAAAITEAGPEPRAKSVAESVVEKIEGNAPMHELSPSEWKAVRNFFAAELVYGPGAGAAL